MHFKVYKFKESFLLTNFLINGNVNANNTTPDTIKSTISVFIIGKKRDKINLIPNKPMTPNAIFSRFGIVFSKPISLTVANLIANMPINTPAQI